VREDNSEIWAERQYWSEFVRVFAHDFLDVNEVGLDYVGSRLINFLCKMVCYLLIDCHKVIWKQFKLDKSRCDGSQKNPSGPCCTDEHSNHFKLTSNLLHLLLGNF